MKSQKGLGCYDLSFLGNRIRWLGQCKRRRVQGISIEPRSPRCTRKHIHQFCPGPRIFRFQVFSMVVFSVFPHAFTYKRIAIQQHTCAQMSASCHARLQTPRKLVNSEKDVLGLPAGSTIGPKEYRLRLPVPGSHRLHVSPCEQHCKARSRNTYHASNRNNTIHLLAQRPS